MWLIFAERFARSVPQPISLHFKAPYVRSAGLMLLQNQIWQRVVIEVRNLFHLDFTDFQRCDVMGSKYGTEYVSASCYLLMPQWALKSPLLKVDLLHYINRYWQWFFFFSSFLSLEKTVIFLEIFLDGVYVCIISNMSILFSMMGRLLATVMVFSQVIYHTLILKAIRRKKVKKKKLQNTHGKCFQRRK